MNAPGTQGSLPSNMFEMDVVKDALQQRIDAGDITREDIDVLRKSYTWVSACTVVGMLSGVPVYILMGRRRGRGPRFSVPYKLFVSSGMSMVGTFLGFTVGGAAASWEVHRKMPDTKRKLAVFEEIAFDARRAIAERRAGIPDGTLISHRAGVPTKDRFTSPEQQREFAQGRFDEAPVSEEISRAANAEASRRAGIPDRAPPPGQLPQSSSTTGQARAGEDELTRRQREFDEMLERERKGGEENKRW